MKLAKKSATRPLPNRGSRSSVLPPPHYKVVLEIARDSSAEFAEQVALRVFGLGRRELTQLRNSLLRSKRAECGVFVREIAETKAAEVMGLANDNEHQLDCFIEKREED